MPFYVVDQDLLNRRRQIAAKMRRPVVETEGPDKGKTFNRHKSVLAVEAIPNPFYNIVNRRQVGCIAVNAFNMEEVPFAEMRTDHHLDEGLTPVVFPDHIRIYGKD